MCIIKLLVEICKQDLKIQQITSKVAIQETMLDKDSVKSVIFILKFAMFPLNSLNFLY